MGGGARGDLLDFIERIPLAADKEDIGSLLVFYSKWFLRIM